MNYEYARCRLVTQTGAKSHWEHARQAGRDQTPDEPLPQRHFPAPRSFTTLALAFQCFLQRLKLLNLFSSFRVT